MQPKDLPQGSWGRFLPGKILDPQPQDEDLQGRHHRKAIAVDAQPGHMHDRDGNLQKTTALVCNHNPSW